jgi:hypothetical protein
MFGVSWFPGEIVVFLPPVSKAQRHEGGGRKKIT